MKEYLEFDDQPTIKMEYTEILDRIKNPRILKLLSMRLILGRGIKIHIINLIIKAMAGVEREK